MCHAIAMTPRCKHNTVDNTWALPRFSESDSKLYTNFEFCEEKKSIYELIYNTMQFFVEIFVEGASDVQVRDFEQVIA